MRMVTGGSGFIGSHLAKNLGKTCDVVVVDKAAPKRPHGRSIKFIIHDLCLPNNALFKDAEEVYHFAASPDVKESYSQPEAFFRNNVLATFNVLESCVKQGIKKMVFASTSAVYGTAKIPTPEDAALAPVSVYGATKAACENLIHGYSEMYGIKAVILRYANIVGPGSIRGVTYDFFRKLSGRADSLEILGDGNQKKSYLHVEDCIDATLTASKNAKKFSVFNVGNEDCTEVRRIASLVSQEMGLENVVFRYAGGKEGWRGDVPLMLLDITKIKRLGWEPKLSSEDAVKAYAKWLVGEGI